MQQGPRVVVERGGRASAVRPPLRVLAEVVALTSIPTFPLRKSLGAGAHSAGLLLARLRYLTSTKWFKTKLFIQLIMILDE